MLTMKQIVYSNARRLKNGGRPHSVVTVLGTPASSSSKCQIASWGRESSGRLFANVSRGRDAFYIDLLTHCRSNHPDGLPLSRLRAIERFARRPGVGACLRMCAAMSNGAGPGLPFLFLPDDLARLSSRGPRLGLPL